MSEYQPPVSISGCQRVTDSAFASRSRCLPAARYRNNRWTSTVAQRQSMHCVVVT